jgi:hypothetical protein
MLTELQLKIRALMVRGSDTAERKAAVVRPDLVQDSVFGWSIEETHVK